MGLKTEDNRHLISKNTHCDSSLTFLCAKILLLLTEVKH